MKSVRACVSLYAGFRYSVSWRWKFRIRSATRARPAALAGSSVMIGGRRSRRTTPATGHAPIAHLDPNIAERIAVAARQTHVSHEDDPGEVVNLPEHKAVRRPDRRDSVPGRADRALVALVVFLRLAKADIAAKLLGELRGLAWRDV